MVYVAFKGKFKWSNQSKSNQSAALSHMLYTRQPHSLTLHLPFLAPFH